MTLRAGTERRALGAALVLATAIFVVTAHAADLPLAPGAGKHSAALSHATAVQGRASPARPHPVATRRVVSAPTPHTAALAAGRFVPAGAPHGAGAGGTVPQASLAAGRSATAALRRVSAPAPAILGGPAREPLARSAQIAGDAVRHR